MLNELKEIKEILEDISESAPHCEAKKALSKIDAVIKKSSQMAEMLPEIRDVIEAFQIDTYDEDEKAQCETLLTKINEWENE